MASKLSQTQILQDVHNPVDHSLQVDAEITAVIGEVEVSINSIDDSIAIASSTGVPLKINSDGSINVSSSGSSTVTGTVSANINGLTVFQTSQYAVGLSAVQLTPTPLTNRSSVSVKTITINNAIVYIGNSSSVTTSNGYPLFNGDSVQLDLTGNETIWAIGSAIGQTVCVLELA